MTSARSLKTGLAQISVASESGSRSEKAYLKTGVQALDELLGGGIPRGIISEVVGPVSSGKTAMLFRILGEATTRGEPIAYIDAFDGLDPVFAQRAGIDLNHVLWVRNRTSSPALKALKAADILVRSESFGVIALDLQPAWPGASNPLQELPFNVWQRLKRLLRGRPTLLLVLSSRACSGSAASLVLNLEEPVVHWREPKQLSRFKVESPRTSHSCLLGGVSSWVRPSRGKSHGRFTLHCRI